MLKEYRKTATIKAEQFDGSEEMIKKYHLIEVVWSAGIHEYSINTKEGLMELWVGDWIATGVEGERWAIADEIFKKTYEAVKYIYRAYAAGGCYEDYQEYEIGFSLDKKKIVEMINEFITEPSYYECSELDSITVQRFALDEFDPLDPDKGYKMDDLYELDYSSNHFVKTEQKYWDKFLNDEEI